MSCIRAAVSVEDTIVLAINFTHFTATTDISSSIVTSTPLRQASNVQDEVSSKQLARKRQRNPQSWKQNVARRQREPGVAYASRDGTERPSKAPKTPKADHHKCGNLRARKVDKGEQQTIFMHFWQLSTSQKVNYYQNTIQSRVSDSANQGSIQREKEAVKFLFHHP